MITKAKTVWVVWRSSNVRQATVESVLKNGRVLVIVKQGPAHVGVGEVKDVGALYPSKLAALRAIERDARSKWMRECREAESSRRYHRLLVQRAERDSLRASRAVAKARKGGR